MYVPHERRALILRLLEQRGYLRTAALAAELGVTEETIRTDIIALHERRLLHRVHGGARYTPPAGGAEDSTRLDCQLISLLLPHLLPGARLYLDGGALAHALLPHLCGLGCSIITASPRLAMAATAPALHLQVSLPGGKIDTQSQWLSPPQAAVERERCLRGTDVALLFPPSLPEPGLVAYPHAARATWAAAAACAAARTIITTPAHAFYTAAAHTAPCTPSLLISEDNLPPAFEQLPAELVPYLSPADLRQGEEEAFM